VKSKKEKFDSDSQNDIEYLQKSLQDEDSQDKISVNQDDSESLKNEKKTKKSRFITGIKNKWKSYQDTKENRERMLNPDGGDGPPGKSKKKGFLWIFLILAVIAGSYYWFSDDLITNPQIFFSSNFLDNNEVSGKHRFTLDQRLIITFDNDAPIGDKYLQIHFSKYLPDGDLKQYESQTRRVMVINSKRMEFHYQQMSFANWGPGKYKVEIINPVGKKLSEKDIFFENIDSLEE
jgi:hypothetical protein